jgi:hypothetical protein
MYYKQTPKDIRYQAIKDLLEAYHSNFEKRKVNPKHRFTIHFKSRWRQNDSIGGIQPTSIKIIDKQAIQLYERMYHMGRIQLQEALKQDKIERDCRIRYSYGKYYLLIPYYRLVQHDAMRVMQSSVGRYFASPCENNAVAFDPGIRTFQTYYGTKEAGKIGAGFHNKDRKQISHARQAKQRVQRQKQDAYKKEKAVTTNEEEGKTLYKKYRKNRDRLRRLWRRIATNIHNKHSG